MLIRNTKISYGGTLTNLVKCLLTNKTFQKSNIIFDGSRHPNFMNPFEYGKDQIGLSRNQYGVSCKGTISIKEGDGNHGLQN